MLENLRQSFYTHAYTLHSWLHLASLPNNPHRYDDLLTAAEYVGRVELLAAILREETNDTETGTEAETLAAEYDRIAEKLHPLSFDTPDKLPDFESPEAFFCEPD